MQSGKKQVYKSGWLNMVRPTAAIDIGSYHTRIGDSNSGMVVDQPTCLALNAGGRVVAYGGDARYMEGRTASGIKLSYPVSGGAVREVEDASKLIRLLSSDLKRPMFGAYRRVVVAQPSSLSKVAARAADQAVRSIQSQRIYRIPSVSAALIGAGVDIMDRIGAMVVVYGAEQTELGVVSQGRIIKQDRLMIGGRNVDDSIRDYMRHQHSVRIGLLQAEAVKMKLSKTTRKTAQKSIVFGKDIHSGMPKRVEIDESELKDIIRVHIRQVGDGVKQLLNEADSELNADVARHGIVIGGGSARLPQVAETLISELGIKPTVARNASSIVFEGALRASLRPNYYRGVLEPVG